MDGWASLSHWGLYDTRRNLKVGDLPQETVDALRHAEYAYDARYLHAPAQNMLNPSYLRRNCGD